ncbi:FecR domain-containing protein [Fidelibacter multiformis]|uniref:FecR family protein n=1 Tax=Fidelibacter multiformis TaxID=3377529 RepID=UPI0037DC64A7
MKYIQAFLIILLILTVIPVNADNQKLAMVAKTRGEVTFRHEDETAFKNTAKAGTILENGDIIKTGKESFVALIFLDDKSQVKLLENCDLEIRGEKIRNQLNKDLSMNFGELKAEISDQRRGEFKISTPTSVASVKGTDFWILSDPRLGDKIIGLSGLVELMNQITGYTVSVGPNQTGLSLTNGNVNVQVTNPNDIPEDIVIDEKELQQLKIQFQNPRGESKNIIIEYR